MSEDERFRIVGPEGIIEDDLAWEDAFALKIERRLDDRYRVERVDELAVPTVSAPVAGEDGPQPVADAYKVRDPSGRELGPIPRSMVVDLVVAGRVDEEAQVSAEAGGWQALAAVPQFAAALHQRTALGLRPGWVEPKWVRPLDTRGLAPLILELAHTAASGWLRVEHKDGQRAGVITIAAGKVAHARSDSRRTTIGQLLVDDGLCTAADVQRAVGMAKDVGVPVGVVLIDLDIVKSTDIEIALVKQADLRLRELFCIAEGTARFEENDAAMGEDGVFDTPPVQLVRDLLMRSGAFFVDAALRGVTRGDVEVLARDSRWWNITESALTDVEVTLATDLSRPGPLGPALLSAQEETKSDELTVAISALLLLSARCLTSRRVGVTPELEAVEGALMAEDPFAALDVGPDAGQIQIQLAVERARGRVRLVAETAPAILARLLARCDEIERRLSNPVEQHVLEAAARMGLSAADASVRASLELDYLRTRCDEAFDVGTPAAARAPANDWVKRAPGDPLALAAQARVWALVGDELEKARGIAVLKALPARFPGEPKLHIALAETALALGQIGTARAQIGAALAAGAPPASIAALDAKLGPA